MPASLRKKVLFVISGPTGSGKTAHSIALAKHFNTAIVSADSRQFFKEIPIGTATPTEEERNGVPHYLLAHLSIHNDYNVYRYERDALHIIHSLFQNHDLVFLVGGSGMYIDALCNGIDNIPDTAPEIRAFYLQKFESEGIEALRFELARLDPESYKYIDLKNPKRIIRALEVSSSTGKPFSSFRTSQKKVRDFEIFRCVINLDRETLYHRINTRVDSMIEAGLEEEARRFYPFQSLNALKTVGYTEFFNYFDGKYSYEEAISLIKRNSRRYAKRQITWFGRESDSVWMNNPKTQELIQLVEKALLQ